MEEDKEDNVEGKQPCHGDVALPQDGKPSTDRTEGSPHTPRKSNAASQGSTVAASPPKFVSFEELMKASHTVTNMTLAHEIAVDKDFKFKKQQQPENSIGKQVSEVMHKAFWDAVEEKLSEDPPDLSHALVLLQEAKELLMDLLLPHHQRFRAHINDVLDLGLIKQKAEHGALDIYYYAEFVVSIMTRLCAPARDERVANIKQIKEVVPLFKEIFAVLELMKMDMANFTIQQIRPYIQQQSVEYERQKFQEFLKTQEENNLDGLQFTKEWLTRSTTRLEQQATAASQTSTVTPAAILNSAYMDLLDWQDTFPFPETLLMDQGRILPLRDNARRASLVAAILLVTYSTVGDPIAGIKDLKDRLKKHILVILGNVPDSQVPGLMANVAAQINKEVNECLVEHNFPRPDDARQTLLQGQIESVASPQHPVHKVVWSRIVGFISQLVSSTQARDAQFPPGLSAVSQELSLICGQFLRLVSHNRAVFGSQYADIIAALLQRHGDISPRQ